MHKPPFFTGLLACITALSATAWETDFGGMPYYTGSVLPTPQEAHYHERYMALSHAAVVAGHGVDADDPRLAVLRHRIEEMGGALTRVADLRDATAYSGIIVLGPVAEMKPALAVPEREEGYVMAAMTYGGKDVLLLQGWNDIGLLWAVVSLNQLITVREGVTAVRMADIRDYPVHTLRGYISGWGRDAVEDELWYIVNFKLNNVIMRRFQSRRDQWRQPQPDSVRAAITRTGELLTPLGIRWYDGYRPVFNDPERQLNIADGVDRDIIYEHARWVLEAGGDFMLNFDDHRYPLHAADKARFGSAREADMYLLQDLHAALTEIRPDFRMLVGPPFYWGPGTHSYLESREDYLRAIGQLPPNVDFFWTGSSVKSTHKTPEQVAWITELIGRKPAVWQNRGWTRHMVNFHYHTDPVTAWVDWHYDGFFDAIAGFFPNTHMPDSAAAVLTLIDYLWNPDAYDAERSAREVAMKLTSPESYPLMQTLNEKLTAFDPYGNRASPAAARDLDKLKTYLQELMAVWEQVEREFGEPVQRWTHMRRYPSMHQRFVERLAARPDLALFASGGDEALRGASEDGLDYDASVDIFISPFDFRGGAGPDVYAHTSPGRPATWIFASGSAYPAMTATFEADPFPAESDYLLVISGQDNDQGEPHRIRIRVNDTVLHDGPGGFIRDGWSQQSFRIPGMSLERYNQLVIESLEPGSNAHRPPWFMLNYAVLRKIED